VGKRRARCCSAMPVGEEGPPGTARCEVPSGAMRGGARPLPLPPPLASAGVHPGGAMAE
jgi:hypothetical protein